MDEFAIKEAKSNPLVMYYIKNKDDFLDIVDNWHDSDSDLEVYEYMGITFSEYAYITNHDFYDNKDKYVNFMDYIIRNCKESQ